MSSGSHQQYLAPIDMAMIKHVLEEAGLACSTTGDDAASFLVREFQDGVTQQLDLALSLDQYLRRRRGT